MQLRNKLLTYFVSLIVVALLAFGLSAYQISYESAVERDKTELQHRLNNKAKSITLDYKKNKSINHTIKYLLDVPDETSAWILIDSSSSIIFPKQIESLFSVNMDLFPLKDLINSSDSSDMLDINSNSYLWARSSLQETGYKLFYIQKSDGSSYSAYFSKLASRLIIVGAIITWVAVWFSLVFSTTVTKKIQYHQDAEDELNFANQILIEAKDLAEKANKTKSDFLSNMSHEIRTPLTSIIGFAESCLDSDQSLKERSKAIKTIIRSGKHLLHIINEILDFSKVEAGKLEVEMMPVSIVEVLDDINQLILIMAEEKGLTFGINYAYPLPDKIISDPLRIKQILINLCSNAIKFTKQGHVYLNVSYLTETSTLIFKIIDTGIGMSEAQQEKIFKPFEQADSSTTRKFGGSGLGLALSQKLANMLDGEISVESTLNKGSHFTLKLNVTEAEDSQYIHDSAYKRIIEKPKEAMIEIPRLNGRVLVAEDNEDIQELIKLIMNKVGVELKIVCSGKDAVNEAFKTEYDLVFMDIQMPVMDGLTAMTELKQHGYRIPVIAMTANAMKKDRDIYNEIGFNGFISKPIDRSELYLLLKQYLQPDNTVESEVVMLTSDILDDEPELIDLIDKFISRLPGMWGAIKQAHKMQDEEEFLRLIHQMKGVGGGYGYPILTEISSKIEFESENKNAEKVNELIEEFDLMTDRIFEGKDENHKIAEQAQSEKS